MAGIHKGAYHLDPWGNTSIIYHLLFLHSNLSTRWECIPSRIHRSAASVSVPCLLNNSPEGANVCGRSAGFGHHHTDVELMPPRCQTASSQTKIMIFICVSQSTCERKVSRSVRVADPATWLHEASLVRFTDIRMDRSAGPLFPASIPFHASDGGHVEPANPC